MSFVKVIYWVSTMIMCAIFAFSAGMYLTNYDMVSRFFEQLGYPTYLIYPSAVLKILGITAILSRQFRILKEWAYAGFFIDAGLATAAHYNNGDGFGLSFLALVAIVISRIYDNKLFR